MSNHLFDSAFPYAPTLHARTAPVRTVTDEESRVGSSASCGGGGPAPPPTRGVQRSAADVNAVHGHLEDSCNVTELEKATGFSRRQICALCGRDRPAAPHS
jgi:hypothetical protein